MTLDRPPPDEHRQVREADHEVPPVLEQAAARDLDEVDVARGRGRHRLLLDRDHPLHLAELSGEQVRQVARELDGEVVSEPGRREERQAHGLAAVTPGPLRTRLRAVSGQARGW